MAGIEQGAQSDRSGFFVPMVDMLAGVIFILIIMLVSIALLARQDFSQVEAAQNEVAAIKRELAAARLAETTYLHPRRQAAEAMGVLLERIRADLVQAGIAVQVIEHPPLLRVELAPAFNERLALSNAGQRLIDVLSKSLSRYVPCLSAQRAASVCASFPPERLARLVLAVHGLANDSTRMLDTQTVTDVQALELFAALGRTAPGLIALRNPSGQKLLGYAGFGDSAGIEKRASHSNGTLDLVFEMDVPPLPAQQ